MASVTRYRAAGCDVGFVTDNVGHRDSPSDMPPRDRQVRLTAMLLRRIEHVARDLAKEAEREGALDSQTALAIANNIKRNIELVIHHLGPARQRPPRPRRRERASGHA